MELHLNDLWVLTDEHSGKPALVKLESGQAYGPGDMMQVNPSGRAVPGYRVVRKLTEGETFSKDEIAFIDRFII